MKTEDSYPTTRPIIKTAIILIIFIFLVSLCSCENEAPDDKTTFTIEGDIVYRYEKTPVDTLVIPYSHYFSATAFNDVFAGRTGTAVKKIDDDNTQFINEKDNVYFESHAYQRFPVKATYQTFRLELTKNPETGTFAIVRVPDQPAPATRIFWLATIWMCILVVASSLFVLHYALRFDKVSKKTFNGWNDTSLNNKMNAWLTGTMSFAWLNSIIAQAIGSDTFSVASMWLILGVFSYFVGVILGPIVGFLFKAIGELVRLVLVLPLMLAFGLTKSTKTPGQAIESFLSYQPWKNGPPVLAWIIVAVYFVTNIIVMMKLDNPATQAILFGSITIVTIIIYAFTIPQRWKFERKEKKQEDGQ